MKVYRGKLHPDGRGLATGSAPVIKDNATHRLTADIGVPYLRLESHHWWSERIVVWYGDVNLERSAFVGCIWGSLEGSLKMIKRLLSTMRCEVDLAEGVTCRLLDLLLNSTKAVGAHDERTSLSSEVLGELRSSAAIGCIDSTDSEKIVQRNDDYDTGTVHEMQS